MRQGDDFVKCQIWGTISAG